MQEMQFMGIRALECWKLLEHQVDAFSPLSHFLRCKLIFIINILIYIGIYINSF